MAKIPHFVRRLMRRRRISWKRYEALRSELSSLNPSRSYEVSAERSLSGFVPLRVGKERELFMVSTSHINHPLMAVLLDLSAEELGFEQIGALRVDCDVLSFQRMLFLIERENSN
nr:putative auxin-responsive protein SAUR71 [Pinus koraiensis]